MPYFSDSSVYFEAIADDSWSCYLDSGIHDDLDKNIFREGRPDDYITMSTNNNYYKWTDKNPIFKQILKFFEQVFPNEPSTIFYI